MLLAAFRNESVQIDYVVSDIKPSCIAYFIKLAILFIFNFFMIFARWVWIVFILTVSSNAASLIVFPSARSCSTSRSRLVKAVEAVDMFSLNRPSDFSITILETSGLRYFLFS